MMVDGAEEGQLRGPIDVLAPYTLLGWRNLHPCELAIPWRGARPQCARRQT